MNSRIVSFELFQAMQKKLLFSQERLQITISRLCQQLAENHENFDKVVLIGLQPRGVYFAKRIHKRIIELFDNDLPIGDLDITFYRDDFGRRQSPLKANSTQIPFVIEGKNVILIDDVLFTGRSINAALNAMTAFGRPQNVELLALIDRKYSRDVPIEPKYVGQTVNSIQSQRVLVEWKEQGAKKDSIWLVNDF